MDGEEKYVLVGQGVLPVDNGGPRIFNAVYAEVVSQANQDAQERSKYSRVLWSTNPASDTYDKEFLGCTLFVDGRADHVR